MAERSFLIVKTYGNGVPFLASCAKCQYKFLTPSNVRMDRVTAEQYLREKFAAHECWEEPPKKRPSAI
jgi:hypothetical protein